MTGKQARRTRLSLKLNQTEFWRRVGVDQEVGSRYERAKHRLPKPVRILLNLIYGKRQQEAAQILALLRNGG